MRVWTLFAATMVLSPAGPLAAQNADEPSLPPVIVRPDRESSDFVPYGYGNGNGYGYNGIPWTSDAIGSDSTPVGPYGQPVWTTQRPYAASRVYVLPPGQVQFEQWVRDTYPRGEKPEYRMLEEIAIGLPGRFQLDLYERWNIEPNAINQEEANHEGMQIEGRWALADWGELWMNPTLYLEWVERGGPQEKPNKYEAKLLLGDEIADNLFFATNFILEQEVAGDERETEWAWSTAWSTPIVERKLMAGIETRWAAITVKHERSNPTEEFLIGPSLQWRPTNRTFLDVVGLFGTTKESPDAQIYIIFGYQFGNRAGPSGGISGPVSTRGN